MANVASPYGFRPVNLIGGLPYAGSVRAIPIASGYATNIFTGSVVAIAADGTIQIVTTNGDNSTPFPAGTIGVAVGFQFTDPLTKTLLNSAMWPASTVASDALCFVVDDPNVLFQVQANGSVTADDLGQNCILAAVQSTSTGNTVTGVSTTAVSATTATTSGYAFRIVDFVRSTSSQPGDAYTDLLVKFNPGAHSYTNGTGI